MIKATLNREFGREMTNDKVVAVSAKNSNCKIKNVAEENKVSLFHLMQNSNQKCFRTSQVLFNSIV